MKTNFPMGAARPTGALRIRPIIFGLAIVEEQVEHRDGTVEWKRAQRAIEISEAKD